MYLYLDLLQRDDTRHTWQCCITDQVKLAYTDFLGTDQHGAPFYLSIVFFGGSWDERFREPWDGGWGVVRNYRGLSGEE